MMGPFLSPVVRAVRAAKLSYWAGKRIGARPFLVAVFECGAKPRFIGAHVLERSDIPALGHNLALAGGLRSSPHAFTSLPPTAIMGIGSVQQGLSAAHEVRFRLL